MAVYQRITGGPFLGHIYQGSVNGTVTMGVIFTHGIADDTRTLTMGLIGSVVQLDHGVQHSSLYGL